MRVTQKFQFRLELKDLLSRATQYGFLATIDCNIFLDSSSSTLQPEHGLKTEFPEQYSQPKAQNHVCLSLSNEHSNNLSNL